MEIIINGRKWKIENIEILRKHIESRGKTNIEEIDLHADEDISDTNFFGLSVLINGDCSVIFYSRYEGDTGLVSHNPRYSGLPQAQLEFVLSNGQVDKYPLAWAVATEDALRALEHTFLHQTPDPRLVWQDTA